MFPRYIVFGLLAVLLCQGLCAEEDNNPIIDKIQKLITQLQENIQNGLETAKNKIKQAVNDLQKTAHDVLDKAKEKMNAAVDEALKAINKISEDAGKVGTDVTECVRDQDQAINDLNDENLQALATCIDTNVDRAGDIADEALNSINNMLGFVSDDLTRLSECDKLSCYLDLAKDITFQLLRIPRKIILIVDHTILTIYGINKDLLLCNADTVLQVVIGTNKIVSEVKTCVADLSSNTTNTKY